MIKDLSQLLVLQGRVVWALLLREMQTRYGRENIGFLWIIGEPILFCGGVAIVWTAIRPAHEHGMPMTAFVITGYVPLTMWRHCVMRGLKAFESNGSLLFHRQVTPLDIILARVVLEVVGTIIAGAIVATLAILLGSMEPPRNIGLIYLGLAYHAVFSLSCSLLIASLSERSDIIEKMMSAVLYLSLPLSGAFVMVNWIPERYQWIMLLSPSVHNVEMIRGGEFGPGVHPIYDLFYDTWSTGLMLLVGLSLTLRSRRFIVVL
jgi:capsular polysaccharide transport system permease protein